MTHSAWVAEATRRFGADPFRWRFVCPACRRAASVRDWKDAGAHMYDAAFACVGRWTDRSCNHSGGGLPGLNPVVVERDGNTIHVFAFAEGEEGPS